jgi:hypothetical protein
LADEGKMKKRRKGGKFSTSKEQIPTKITTIVRRKNGKKTGQKGKPQKKDWLKREVEGV